MKNKRLNIVAIIPARGGSKGVPGKNIRLLAGKPLIAYTIEEAKKSKYIDRIIVSTDDKKIAYIANKYGAEVPFMRSVKFSGDNVSVIPDTVRYIVKELEKMKYEIDMIVVLQPTSPLRKAKHIDEAVQKLIMTKADWIVSISEVDQHPFRMRTLANDKLLPFIKDKRMFMQRQDLPKVYIMNGAIYVTTPSVLVQKNCLFEKDFRGIVMDREAALDIDTEKDFFTAEAMMKWRSVRISIEGKQNE